MSYTIGAGGPGHRIDTSVDTDQGAAPFTSGSYSCEGAEGGCRECRGPQISDEVAKVVHHRMLHSTERFTPEEEIDWDAVSDGTYRDPFRDRVRMAVGNWLCPRVGCSSRFGRRTYLGDAVCVAFDRLMLLVGW